jgi:GDYXXLXY protein
MNRAALRVATLVFPLLGLAAAWIATHHRAQQGVEWEVPVSGFDPRDLLRGHYIAFQYNWPGLEPANELAVSDGLGELCLAGHPPQIERVHVPAPGEACANRVRADDINRKWPMDLRHGRIYVPQRSAPAMESKLRNPQYQAMVRFRLHHDGHITPRAMTFRKRAAVP